MVGERYFGPFEFRPATLELLREGRRVPLRPQPARALALLLANGGEVVTRERLQRDLWGDTTVSEKSLNFCVLQLRRALGDDAAKPTYVATVPKVGYRFLASALDRPATADARKRRSLLIAAAASLAIAIGTPGSLPPGSHARAPGASDAFERARYLLEKPDPHSRDLATAYLESVVEMEPEWAEAWAELGSARMRQWLPDPTPARQALQRAVALDPDLAIAHLRLGDFSSLVDWDWEAALLSYQRAIALDATLAEAHHHLASLYAMRGDPTAAVEAIQRALELDPVNVSIRGDAGWIYLSTGLHRAALGQCRRTLELEPSHRHALECVVHAQLAVGRTQNAFSDAETLLRLDGTWSAPVPENPVAEYYRLRLEALAHDRRDRPVERAISHAALGQRREALESLADAFERRDPRLLLWIRDPRLAPLRDDPRFRSLLGLLRLPALLGLNSRSGSTSASSPLESDRGSAGVT